MKDTHLPCFRIKPDFYDALAHHLAADFEFWASLVGADGLCRLQLVASPPENTSSGLPGIPFKKLLLPPAEPLWSWDGKTFQSPDPQPRRAVFGVALCDLQALWYLDQVFAEDPLYQERRQHLLIVGGPCQPADQCRCHPDESPLAGDLFQTHDHIWSLSNRGHAVLKELAKWLGATVDRPLPKPLQVPKPRADIREPLFRASTGSAIWQQSSQSCLACGVCSAVCPTCYCYDMIDHTDLDGKSTRQRVWDNCFFSTHAKVAGGHDFRPDRAARLRFRFEHKKFGFGPLRGRPSCVGCGRCLKACPVDIDLDQIAEQLNAGEA